MLRAEPHHPLDAGAARRSAIGSGMRLDVGSRIVSDTVLSVVIPVYNRAEPIRRAIASVIASVAHAQLGRDRIELIVVDDGSRDGSADAARAATSQAGSNVHVIVLEQANAGPAAARNIGVVHAQAPIVAFLDSDDVWFDWTLRACLRAVESYPDAALFFLQPRQFSDLVALEPSYSNSSTFEVYDGFIAAALSGKAPKLGTNNAMIRRAIFHDLDGFDVNFRCFEDADLFVRADPTGTCVILRGDDLLGRQRGKEDSLIDNWSVVLDGSRKMKLKEHAGLYPGGTGADPRRTTLISRTAIGATRLCFANGQWARAYGTFFTNVNLMFRGGMSRWLWRLPLTPLLSLFRPNSHRFRLRPATSR